MVMMLGVFSARRPTSKALPRAKEGEQALDIADCLPRDLAAARRELLDRLPEGERDGARRAELHVDDEKTRPLAEPGPPAEPGGAIGALLLLRRDRSAPGGHWAQGRGEPSIWRGGGV
jgi:hypothetical protein